MKAEVKLYATLEEQKKKEKNKRIPEKHLLLFHLKPLITRNCRKFLKRWEHQTTLLPPEKYAGQEATVRIGHGTTDRLKIGKEINQGYILSLCLFNSYAGYVMQNASLDETEAGIKITGGNNNLRYADGTTLMAESQEELRSLLMKVKEESEKDGLKLNIQKSKIMASSPINSWQINGETVETVTDFILGAPKSLQMVTAAMKLKDVCSLEEKL